MSKTWMFVGGCNRPLPYFTTANAPGVSAFAFDAGDATPAGATGGIDNPTFVAVHPNGRTLYATSEVLGWNEGLISAYAIDPATGALDYLNKQPTRGSIAAQASFDESGEHLFVVNYSVGPMTQKPNRALVVYKLDNDGALSPPLAEAAHEGHGPDPARQERPHPHCVRMTPDGRRLIVSDLGLDRLVVYSFDGRALAETSRIALPAASGPRHFVFHPRLPLIYVANELASTVAVADLDGVRAVLPTVPAGTRENHCSEIQLSPDARWLFVANRGHHSLARFAVSGAGELTAAGHVPAGGRTPRHFAFDPTGAFVAVANQDSDEVKLFAYDAANGELREHAALRVGTPTCIAFASL